MEGFVEMARPFLAVAGVATSVLLAACGGDPTGSDASSTPATSVETHSTPRKAPAPKRPGSAKDRRGDAPPELDLVRVSARHESGEYVLRWTLAARPRGTLVAVTASNGSVAAVKIYADRSLPTDAYVFNGENTYLHDFQIDGRTITLHVPDVRLGPTSTLKTSTERVGGVAADHGPSLAVP